MSNNALITQVTKALLLLCVSFGVSSCTGPLDPKTAAGEYAYQYKTGEVEVIRVNDNNTFVHEVYNTQGDYTNRKQPAFEEADSYRIENRQLKTKSWSMFYDMLKPGNRVQEPYGGGGLELTWYPPDKKVDAALVYTEDGYYFRRMKERSAIIE
jgi:hypothetical protein